MKIGGLLLVALLVQMSFCASYSQEGNSNTQAYKKSYVDEDGWIHYDKEPGFRTGAPLREGQYPIGAYAGAFGGANIMQDGNLSLTSPDFPGSTVTIKTKDSLGGVAGIRGGYTWYGLGGTDGYPPSGVDGTPRILPTVQGEFFWTGYKYRAKENSDDIQAEFTADTNIYVFSFDPILKFQIGAWRPYLGFGIGGAYITADNATVGATTLGSTGLSGDDNAFAFAVQLLGGTEYFISQRWSLSLDYKYLALINPEFDSPDKSVHYSFDSQGNHIVTVGVNFYF